MFTNAPFTASVAGGPPLAARLRAALSGWRLDGALAAGADPASNAVLAARAARLRSRRARSELADGLEQIVAGAARPARPRDAIWAVHRPTVRGARMDLLDLAAQLRGEADLDPRGVALARRLLVDGTGPLHSGDADALACTLAEIRAALRCRAVA